MKSTLHKRGIRAVLSMVMMVVVIAAAFPLTKASGVTTARAESRATNWLQNGSFESTLTNWTKHEARVDLGVTVLGGCATVDTVDYAGIFTRDAKYGLPVPSYTGGTNPKMPVDDNDTGSFSGFSVTTPGDASGNAPTDGSSLAYLNLGSGSGNNGFHVVHGPAIVSDDFKGVAGQVITLDWYAKKASDDAAVFGYLLDTDANGNGVAEGTVADCAQYEILDTTVTTVTSWQYADVTIPHTRAFYKFVFVGGTFDKSGGNASGAGFWIDNISQGSPQTITMDLSDVTGKNYHASGGTSPAFSIAGQATTPSGLPITYASTTTGVCTVSGTTVTITGHGTCTLRASQPGGTDGSGTLWAAAPSVTDDFIVTNTAPTPQTITFGALPAKTLSATPFSVSPVATTSSGGTVTYTSSTTAVCTVTSAGMITLKTTGTCTITANAAVQTVGGTLYAAATPVPQSFTVSAVQTITFNPTDQVYTAPDYNLTATIAPATGLALTYSASTTPLICTVSASGSVNLLDVGVCTVTVTAAAGSFGGVAYGESTVTKSFKATGAVHTITFPTLPEWRLYQGDEITPAAVANSGLPVTYTAGPPEVCSIVGGKVKVAGLGKCTVKAAAAAGTGAGTKYGAAADVLRAFFITDTKPTATFTPANTRTPTPTQTPTPIPFLLKKGAVGASFVLGLLQNDTLVTWGMSREGQASIAPCCNSAIQDIAVGTNFALVLKGGRVFGWGANTKGQMNFPTSTKSGIKAVAAGGAHGLALTTAGAVISWGDNIFGQSKVPALKKVVSSVVGGNNHTVVLYTDGTVGAWGQNSSKQASPPPTLKGITQIAAGLDHNLALTDKATVLSWGGNSHGQAKIPTNAIDIKQVSAGTQFSMAVKKNGDVIAWGRNDYNQTGIPKLNNIYSAFAGYANTILGLRNGRIVVLGDQSNGIAVSRTPTPTP